ncbi:MAG: hypothetical protein ABL957_01775 [Parvularculaceae bacterium]
MTKRATEPGPLWRRRLPVSLILPAGAAFVVIVALAAFKIEGGRSGAASNPRSLAAEFSRNGDYQIAAETLRAAWRAQPTEGLRLEAARAFLIAGDNLSALELLKDHATESSYEFSRRHLYAEALVRSRRYQAATMEADLLAASSAADGRARLLASRIAYGLGDFDKAGRDLGAAIRIGGDSLAEAWLFRVRMALNENDLDAARSAAARAEAAGASALAVQAIEIEALARGGAYVEALSRLASLEAGEDTYGKLLAAKLSAFLDASEGRYEDAARRLRQIGPLVEADPYGDLFIARVAGLAGDSAQSAAGVEKSLEASPGNPAIAEASVDKLIDSGRLEAAAAAAERLIVNDPSRGTRSAMRAARAAESWRRLARLALNAPKAAPPPLVDAMLFGAHSMAAKSSAAEREADRSLIETARTALDSDNRAAAETVLKLAGAGADPASRHVAAWILIAANADEAARATLQLSDPGDETALIDLARLDVRAGDLVAAETRLAAADNSIEARIARARAAARQGRLEDAASILVPLVAHLTKSGPHAAFAAEVFSAVEQRDLVLDLAVLARRDLPEAPETPGILLLAGRIDEAMSMARTAVLAYPADIDRIDRYAVLALKAQRQTEAQAFLAELSAKSGEATAIASAVRILDGAAPPDGSGGTTIPVRDARNAYLESVHSSSATLNYAAALAAAGETESAIRLRREGCFWSSAARCEASQ